VFVLLGAGQKRGVPDGGLDNQIDGSREQRLLQSFLQAKVGVGVRACGQRLEFNQKVDVTPLRIEVSTQGGAESSQALDMVLAAELRDLFAILFDLRVHSNSVASRGGAETAGPSARGARSG
jgi:hypothetical protein